MRCNTRQQLPLPTFSAETGCVSAEQRQDQPIELQQQYTDRPLGTPLALLLPD
jgi:hypothetical protein